MNATKINRKRKQPMADDAAGSITTHEGGLLIPKHSADGHTKVFATFSIDHEWPCSTKEACRYDLHGFEGQPMGIPIKFNEKTKRYQLEGFFCSVSCAAAYLRESLRSVANNIVQQRLTIFDRFLRTVVNIPQGLNSVELPPPLSLLCTLIAEHGDCEAVKLWRSNNNIYRDMRAIPHMFERVTTLFEQEHNRISNKARHQRHIELTQKTDAQMFLLTERGRQEQQKYVRKKLKEKNKPPRNSTGAIDTLLGITVSSRNEDVE